MPMLRWLAGAALITGIACSGGSTGYTPPPPPPPPPPGGGGHSTTITVSNNAFTPSPDTVNAGTITFRWTANAITHNVTWQTGPTPLPANSGNKGASETYQPTVQAGSYTYHCTLHAGMDGILVVLP